MATWQDNPGLLQSGQPLFGSSTSGLLGYSPKSIPHYIGPKVLPDFSFLFIPFLAHASSEEQPFFTA